MSVTWQAEPYPTLTISGTGWTDVNLSSYLPANATGAIIHFYHSATRTVGVRDNGSTDSATGAEYQAAAQKTFIVGVDASQIFEFYINTNSSITVRLYGWFTNTDSYFFVNRPAYSGTATTWTDINISSNVQGTDVPVLAHFYVWNSNIAHYCNLRCNGSTDNRLQEADLVCGMSVGLDGSYICECYASTTSEQFYLAGYTTTNYATVYVNCTDYKPSSTGSWQNLTALPAGAVGGFFQVTNASSSTEYNYGIRINGGSDNYYYGMDYYSHSGYPMACDANRICQGEIVNSNIHFWLHGIAKAVTIVAGVTATLTASANVGAVNVGAVGQTAQTTMGSNVGAVDADIIGQTAQATMGANAGAVDVGVVGQTAQATLNANVAQAVWDVYLAGITAQATMGANAGAVDVCVPSTTAQANFNANVAQIILGANICVPGVTAQALFNANVANAVWQVYIPGVTALAEFKANVPYVNLPMHTVLLSGAFSSASSEKGGVPLRSEESLEVESKEEAKRRAKKKC